MTKKVLGAESSIVDAFCCCKFQFSKVFVVFLLQATIGRIAEHFRFTCLSDWVFKFCVSSKTVGSFIYNLESFECNLYNINFHLWGNGGMEVSFGFGNLLTMYMYMKIIIMHMAWL